MTPQSTRLRVGDLVRVVPGISYNIRHGNDDIGIVIGFNTYSDWDHIVKWFRNKISLCYSYDELIKL